MKVKKSLRSCIMALVLCLSLSMSALAYESVTCKSGTNSTRIALAGSRYIGKGNEKKVVSVCMSGSMAFLGTDKVFQFTGQAYGAFSARAYKTTLTIHCTKNGTGTIVFDAGGDAQSISGNTGTISWSNTSNRIHVKFDSNTNFLVKSSRGNITQLNVYCSAYVDSPYGSGDVFSGDDPT